LKSIPFLNLSYQHAAVSSQIQDAITRISDRNWFVLGKEVDDFEKAWADYSDVPFCVGVANGLDALTLSLVVLGIGPGDEVIVPAHTYIATWLAVSRTGATLVPVDADQSTFNIDVTTIEQLITPRTRAILPVHLYGQACDMTAIDNLARKHDLDIVEDNAQAHGGRWLTRKTGSFGVVNATSFYPTKNLGAWGDGGSITTHREDYDRRVRLYRNYGSVEKNVHIERGVNSRLDEIQAAILLSKLIHLDEWNEMRRDIAEQYLLNLTDVGDLILPRSCKEAYHVYHQFVVRSHRRDKLKSHLKENGIETMIHYPVPPFLQPAFTDLAISPGHFPVSALIASTALSLPVWPGMTATEVDYICETVRSFFR
jgi:dTDP-4-amino-4,6-dideoxygalactose transaminase